MTGTEFKSVEASAGEVEPGWRLLYGGETLTVAHVQSRRAEPYPSTKERQVLIWFEGRGTPVSGEEGQTVYRIIEEAT